MDIIFDIDGTLSDPSHRRHHVEKQPKDWDGFFDTMVMDAPVPQVITVANALYHFGHHVLIVTGRPQSYERQTASWLAQHLIPYDGLWMRPAGDRRDDTIIKAELYDRIISEGFKPTLVFEDRARLVKMWRDKGLVCAQVAEGRF